MKTLAEQPLSGIVLEHHEVIPVMEKYSFDFCCNGKKTLAEVCREKQIDLGTVLAEIEQVGRTAKPGLPFGAMNVVELISYILIHHHFYVRQVMPTIYIHIEKVAVKHGDRYPHMKKVLEIFSHVREEMEAHMLKEENILFPRIREIAAAKLEQQQPNLAASYISAPIALMELEHDHAGAMLFEIRELTHNYKAPDDACTTHQVCLEELKAFEEDLHQHVHLENNILFPKASKMLAALQ